MAEQINSEGFWPTGYRAPGDRRPGAAILQERDGWWEPITPSGNMVWDEDTKLWLPVSEDYPLPVKATLTGRKGVVVTLVNNAPISDVLLNYDFFSAASYTVVTGSFTADTSEGLIKTDGESENILLFTSDPLDDVFIKATVKGAGGTSGSPCWRLVDALNFYYLRLNSEFGDNGGIAKRQGGTYSLVKEGSFPVSANLDNDVTVRHVGENITVWINGDLWASVVDDSLTNPGHVGFRGFGAGHQISRFILAPDGTIAELPPFSRWTLYATAEEAIELHVSLSPDGQKFYPLPESPLAVSALQPLVLEMGYDAHSIQLFSDSDADAIVQVRGVV